ncbi:MAG TPA: TIGR04086 family membrane protein [Lachnospiraceae bacterium]|uniref:TIGR04086 family membrane protein n=1 Tax=Anaerosporobacter sp. TaxID=1872529 RepID=UPI000ED9DA32|nr:TIGR04086 family membrane protein [Anaerosporobacter sp.]MBS5932409.1 TIGR04086 family membrane protein [Clostridiales bacterium]HAB60680.1 TIGR04086 family membrane protein [Lachnospiraceae bacterium]
MNKAAGKNTLPIHIAKALIFSYIVTAVILLLLSFILYKVQIPSGVVSVGVILAYILSTFVGGFFIGKKVEARKFLWGLAIGAIYFLLVIIISIVMNKAAFGSAGSIVTVLGMCLLGGMLGGMIS